MMRAILHDDPRPDGKLFGGKVRLDDDSVASKDPLSKPQVHPTVTVKQRTLSGYDDDGNAEYAWETLVEGTAVVWQERREADDLSGKSLVTARLVVLYAGDTPVDETAVVEHSWSGTFATETVTQVGNRLEFERLVRLDVRDQGES